MVVPAVAGALIGGWLYDLLGPALWFAFCTRETGICEL
jgi:hypothetical protein